MDTDRVLPIALTHVAWPQYLKLCSELLGRSPSKSVDNCPSSLSEYAKYTVSLGEFRLGDVDARKLLRSKGPWLRHTFYSFLILTSNSTTLEMAESTDLDVLSAPAAKTSRLSVVSGNLEVWRNSVIVCCTETTKTRTRALFNNIKGMFDQLGLSDVWFNYKTKSLKDDTYSLEYKP